MVARLESTTTYHSLNLITRKLALVRVVVSLSLQPPQQSTSYSTGRNKDQQPS